MCVLQDMICKIRYVYNLRFFITTESVSLLEVMLKRFKSARNQCVPTHVLSQITNCTWLTAYLTTFSLSPWLRSCVAIFWRRRVISVSRLFVLRSTVCRSGQISLAFSINSWIPKHKKHRHDSTADLDVPTLTSQRCRQLKSQWLQSRHRLA